MIVETSTLSRSFPSLDASPTTKIFPEEEIQETLAEDVFKQPSPSSCGKTAAAILLKERGYMVAPDFWKKDIPGQSAFGASKEDVIEIIRSHNAKYILTEFTNTQASPKASPSVATKEELLQLRDLIKTGGPAIALMRSAPHIIVIEEVAEDLGSAIVSDPYEGKRLKITREALQERAFGGVYAIQIPCAPHGCCVIL